MNVDKLGKTVNMHLKMRLETGTKVVIYIWKSGETEVHFRELYRKYCYRKLKVKMSKIN